MNPPRTQVPYLNDFVFSKNDPKYTHYVVKEGKIESGWWDEHYANTRAKEIQGHMRSCVRVMILDGLDPDNNQDWF